MQTWKVITAAAILAVILFGYGGYRYQLLGKELEATEELFAATVADFKGRVAELEEEVSQVKEKNQDLVAALIEEVEKHQALQGEFKGLSALVSDYEKLNKLDPELLEKYSKIYFLNENYAPAELVDINPKYIEGEGIVQIYAKVWPFLKTLLEDADTGSVPIRVISGYRSFGEQSALKSSYKVTYGAGTANKFSADQGYSEHQLGTTLDFTTPDIGAGYTKFESTLAYTWLLEHAHEYGFTLSYPKGNAYYIFEPWHWRFVGVALATKLHNEGTYFYDLDQRTIDEYRIKIFDEL